MYSMLKQKCDGVNDAVIAFAQELVRVPSPTFDEGKVADLVRQKMRDLATTRSSATTQATSLVCCMAAMPSPRCC